MNHSELESLWRAEGGRASASDIAAAIAQAESGGSVNAENHNTNGTIDRGLWQINSIHGPLSTFSPTGNARSAIIISADGTDWSPWVTYNTGAYRQFLTGVSNTPSGSGGFRNVLGIPFGPQIPGTPELLPGEGGPQGLIEKALGGSSGFFDFLKKFPEIFKILFGALKLLFTREGIIRIGKVLIGVLLLLVGVFGMANIQAPGVVAGAGGKVGKLAVGAATKTKG